MALFCIGSSYCCHLLSKSFQFQPSSIQGTCGGDVLGTEIDFPVKRNYSDGSNCKWRISRSSSFILRFHRLDIEECENCDCDSLQIDGGEKLCGRDNSPRDIYFANSSISLTFTSDGSVNRRGFKVEILGKLDC